jgi:hypothetical protein
MPGAPVFVTIVGVKVGVGGDTVTGTVDVGGWTVGVGRKTPHASDNNKMPIKERIFTRRTSFSLLKVKQSDISYVCSFERKR